LESVRAATLRDVVDSARPEAISPVMRAVRPMGMDGLPARRHAVMSGPDITALPDGPAGPHPVGISEVLRPAAVEGTATVRDVARQIVAHPMVKAGGAAELHLAPEELGQLRLSVEPTGDGLRVTIEALRPETADLLRRHVEVLRQELRQDGLGSVSVSIGGGEAGRGSGAPPDRSQLAPVGSLADGTAATAPLPTTPPLPRPHPAAGQLDLRF
jgi:hypothetical protein